MANKSEGNQKVNPVKVPLETDQGILESEERKWGLPLREVYKHGLSFYKGKIHTIITYITSFMIDIHTQKIVLI